MVCHHVYHPYLYLGRHVIQWGLGSNPSIHTLKNTRVLTRSRRILSARKYDIGAHPDPGQRSAARSPRLPVM